MHLGYTSAASRGAKSDVYLLRQLRKPILTVLKWQFLATVALALLSALFWGWHGAASALAGGVVSMAAGIAAALAASLGPSRSPASVVMGALRGEAVKLGVGVGLLWLVLATYHDAIVGALIGAFVVTLVIFAMGFFVRDY